MTRPTACTTSTCDLRGSRKSTASRAGTSISLAQTAGIGEHAANFVFILAKPVQTSLAVQRMLGAVYVFHF